MLIFKIFEISTGCKKKTPMQVSMRQSKKLSAQVFETRIVQDCKNSMLNLCQKYVDADTGVVNVEEGSAYGFAWDDDDCAYSVRFCGIMPGLWPLTPMRF